MWIAPKPLNLVCYSADAYDVQVELLAQNVFVKGAYSTQGAWRVRLRKTTDFGSFICGRILKDDNGIRLKSVKSCLISYCERNGCSIKQAPKKTDWADLPLFNLASVAPLAQSAPRYCSLGIHAWASWDKQIRAVYKERTAQSSVKTWPTPTQQDSPHKQIQLTERGRRAPTKGKTCHSLNLWDAAVLENKSSASAQMWATPVVGDAHLSMTKPLAADNDGAERINTTLRQVCHTENYDGQLNPRWVDSLMGLPIGWTRPRCTIFIAWSRSCVF